MSTKVSKPVWVLLLVAGIAVLVFVAASGRGRDRAVAVTVTRAARQDLQSWITGNGKVEPTEPHIIQAQLATRIETVNVAEGQAVQAGKTLLRLDATDARSELSHTKEQLAAAQEDRKTALQGGPRDESAQLASDLAKINADVMRLTRERDSIERLVAGQAATRQELDQNGIALEKAQAEKRLLEEKKSALSERSAGQAERAALRADEARDSIRSLEQKIASANVAAPASGTIYALSAKPGTFVHVGDTLAEIADLRRARVRAFIDEPELGSLKEGQHVEITWDALPNRVWTGVVAQLPKTIVTRGSRNVGEVLCSVDNEESELLPNTNVTVRIRTAQRNDALTLPRAAVRTEGGKRYVLAVENGKLKKREVTVGISSPTTYEIIAGITENDQIALQSDADLREGQTVAGTERK